MDCLHRFQVASGAMCEDTGQGCAACAAAASNVAMLSCFNSFGVPQSRFCLVNLAIGHREYHSHLQIGHFWTSFS